MSIQQAEARRRAPLRTPNNLSADATRDLSGALNLLVADFFALYVKSKNFHWHMAAHFRDYHLLLDEQADQIFSTIHPAVERVRNSAARRCARLAISPASSACWTTTLIT